MTGAFGRSCPDLGDFQPPTLETLPEAVARNVVIARARTRARIMAVVRADGYGHGACTVAQAAVAAGRNSLARQTDQSVAAGKRLVLEREARPRYAGFHHRHLPARAAPACRPTLERLVAPPVDPASENSEKTREKGA